MTNFSLFLHKNHVSDNKKKFYFYKNTFKYYLHFASLVSPYFINEPFIFEVSNSQPLPRKIHVKKSYLIFSWFNYLTNVRPDLSQQTKTKRSDSDLKVSEKNGSFRLTLLPSKRSLYTFQKAPMAHKTNSKEQFMFKFYFFKFSIFTTVPHNKLSNSVGSAILLSHLIRKVFPCFETNLLFLKYYQVSSLYFDSHFFNFYLFEKRFR